MKDDNFDLVLAIPCDHIKVKKNIISGAESSFEKYSDDPIIFERKMLENRNTIYDNKSNLLKYAKVFCEEIKKHSEYEMVYNDISSKSSSITTTKKPLTFGQVIIYEDVIDNKFIPYCCYNFFAVLSELTITVRKEYGKYGHHTFHIVYLVVPDINYHDLTLLMDQSHELWCNIGGNIDDHLVFSEYLRNEGYNSLGKIYRIIFSDMNQFEAIKDDETKLFNILAAEEYKNKEDYTHQIELSENTDEYIYSSHGKNRKFIFAKKEKFYDDYNMYSSYKAYASLYSYYYIINEENNDLFHKRIESNIENENFSSEANILFVLENEIFKITVCLVSNIEINEQINNPDMVEIQNMFGNFINTRPLFEKLNYRYLGAQKEADFIYKQFRIDDILDDYDCKRELLRNYCEVTTSVISNKNSKILNCIGLIFAFIAGWDRLAFISKLVFDETHMVTWDYDLIIPVIVSILIIVILIRNIQPIKMIKRFFKSLTTKKPSA
jgi:hypothetical protein